MQSFDYKKARSVDEALGSYAGSAGALNPAHIRFLGGGTTLIDLMKLDVETPKAVVDVNALPWKEIENLKQGGLRIGALVKNSDLAHHPQVKKDFSVLSEALLAGASAQLRNKATTAGNLLQRTRCVYFRDPSKPCNKREPKSGCSAIQGFNRNLAIMGTSPDCIATNPSDMNIAMMALEAKIQLQNAKGSREVPIHEFYLLPGSTPEKETVLQPRELITAVHLDSLPAGTKSSYLKLRDRASYEFALSSAAIVSTMKAGKIERIRIAMGGIGTVPWRCLEAEKILEGGPATTEQFQKAAAAVLKDAKPQSENGFKVELAKRCLVSALQNITQS